jgi:Zn-dependent peptidase ImmA (M78 family)/transcriptional regulator with XRE-family HTH domain
MGVSPASVTQYEAGNTHPPAGAIRQAALALGVPVEYLYIQPGRRVPKLETRSHFRSLRATRQRQRDQADAAAEHLYDLVEFLDQRLDLPTVDIPLYPLDAEQSAPKAIEIASSRVREAWGLPDGPVSHMVRLLETKGVVVARLGEVPAEVDAFSRWLDRRPIVLLSTAKQDKGRSRFDAAHELGHLVLHPEPEAGDRVRERQAHAFAASFLMPAPEVVFDLPRRLTRPEHWEELFAARRRWGVSAAALLYRSRELAVISDAAFRRAMTHLSKQGLRRHDGNALGPPEQPLLIQEALRSLQDAFELTPSDVAQSLRFSERMVLKLIGDFGAAKETERAPAGSVRHLRAVHSDFDGTNGAREAREDREAEG